MNAEPSMLKISQNKILILFHTLKPNNKEIGPQKFEDDDEFKQTQSWDNFCIERNIPT